MASVATGSTADISEPNANDSVNDSGKATSACVNDKIQLI